MPIVTKILFIKASPRGANSKSIALAEAYLSTLRAKIPELSLDTLELWNAGLPEFDGSKNVAKLTVFGGATPEGPIKTAWDEIVAIANRFISADIYLIATPMWNGGVPYKLKHYIDLIHQPGLTFGFDPSGGYIGLLKNKKAIISYTAGAWGPSLPSPAFGVDHQSTYLKSWLNQAGVTDISEIRFQPTILTADPEGDFNKAKAAAIALAN